MKASARCLIVATTICSWIAISNHCACKILRAVFLAKTKNWARDDAKVSSVDLCVEERAPITYSSRNRTLLLLDTGPLGARSFAELILQRSLLAHAPPFHA